MGKGQVDTPKTVIDARELRPERAPRCVNTASSTFSSRVGRVSSRSPNLRRAWLGTATLLWDPLSVIPASSQLTGRSYLSCGGPLNIQREADSGRSKPTT